MNRQVLLETIDRQLSESFAESASPRAIDEFVKRVAGELNLRFKPPGSQSVIPIELIAAFVDGGLDRREEAAICEAATIDASVLAELVSAVRMKQTALDDLPPLPEGLAARLLAMRRVDSRFELQPENPESPPIVLRPPVAEFSRRPSPYPRRRVVIGIVAGALAASLVGLVFLLKTGRSPQSSKNIANHVLPDGRTISPEGPTADSDPTERSRMVEPPEDNEIRPERSDLPSGSDAGMSVTMMADVAEQPDSVETAPATLSAKDPIATSEFPDPDRSANPHETAGTASIARVDEIPTESSVEVPPPVSPLLGAVGPTRTPLSIRWTEVTGVLAQRDPRSSALFEPDPDLATSGPGNGAFSGSTMPASEPEPPWTRIQQGVVSDMYPSMDRRITVQTLPFSRAEGEFMSGGRLVVSGDTGLVVHPGETDQSIEIDLMHGSIALVGLQEGATVALTENKRTLNTLRWQSRASAVIYRIAGGFQFQVDGGTVEVNDQPVDDESVQVGADGRVQSITDAPKRLPRWITRPYDSSAVERRILAQMSDSDDVNRSLNMSIRSLASSDRLSPDELVALNKLAAWRVSLAGPNLYRLIANRIPAVRLAALQRIAQTAELDPRYRPLWQDMDRAINNERKSRQIRQWFHFLRTGTRPNNQQIQLLISGLATRDMAMRSVSDFVLRQFTVNPPPYDPSWTGTTLQRAINVYRQRTGVRAAVSADGTATRIAPAANSP